MSTPTENPMQITQRMERLVDSNFRDFFKCAFTYEDVEEVLELARNTNDRQMRLELRNMLKFLNEKVTPEMSLDEMESLFQKHLISAENPCGEIYENIQEWNAAILEKLEETYNLFPKQHTIMARIVNRFSDSGKEEDSLRLRILKQLLKHIDFTDTDIDLGAAAAFVNDPESLTEDIFDVAQDEDNNDTTQNISALIGAYGKILPVPPQTGKILLSCMNREFREEYTAKYTAQVEYYETAETASNPWQKDPFDILCYLHDLRPRLKGKTEVKAALTDFPPTSMNRVFCEEHHASAAKTLRELVEDYKNKLKKYTASSKQADHAEAYKLKKQLTGREGANTAYKNLRPKNNGPDLLYIANFLATGGPETINPTTAKKALWICAYAFDLKYCLPNDLEKNSDRDVSKFFHDFYTDSMNRLIAEENEYKHAPPGCSISCRSYWDALLIYYLNRKKEITRKDRLRQAFLKAQEIMTSKKSESNDTFTLPYRDVIIPRLLSLEPEQLKDYVESNFVFKSRHMDHIWNLVTESKSANKIYLDYYRKFFSELAPSRWVTIPDFSAALSAAGFYNSPTILRLIERVMKRLTPPDLVVFSNNGQDYTVTLKDNSQVTRTNLIAIFFQYYCGYYLEKTCSKSFLRSNRKSLADVFTEFSIINTKLEVCGFQPLSDKNLFDILTLIIAYGYINESLL